MCQLFKKNKGTDDDDRSEYTNESQEEYAIEEPTKSTEKQSVSEEVTVELTNAITPVDNAITANKEVEDDDDDFDDVPQEYLFPSYCSCITYGPLAADQLSVSLTDDDNMHKGEDLRAKKRKSDSMSKNSEASNNSSAVRGFLLPKEFILKPLMYNISKYLTVVTRYQLLHYQ